MKSQVVKVVKNTYEGECEDNDGYKTFEIELMEGLRSISIDGDNIVDKFQQITISIKRDGQPLLAQTHVVPTRPCHDEAHSNPAKRVCRRENDPDRTGEEVEADYHNHRREMIRKKWNASYANPGGKIRLNFDTVKVSCVIVGHSFVRHLMDCMEDCYNTHNWTYALNLDNNNVKVHMFGMSGAHISNMNTLFTFVKDMQARIVVLEMGTNDLAGNKEVHKICNQLIRQCCVWLNKLPSIESIAWCHVIPRNRAVDRRVSTPTVRRFNRRMSIMNRIMAQRVGQHERIHHWRHRGLSRATVAEVEDGIHPTSEPALWKYQKSISRLIRWSRTNLPACDSDSD